MIKRAILSALCALSALSIAALAACTVDSGEGCISDSDCNAGFCYRGFCVDERDGGPPDVGLVDGGEACPSEGELRSCYDGPLESDHGNVPCHGGQQECRAGFWGRCIGQVLPQNEINCNGVDDNCDHIIDEIAGLTCTTGLNGICASGVKVCQGSDLVCTATNTPTQETCNNRDDNCNNETDENITAGCYDMLGNGCTARPGGGFDCLGVCKPGMATCTNGQLSACAGEVLPLDPEVCTSTAPGELAVDENCNGEIDEGCVCNEGSTYACYTGPQGSEMVAPCQPGMSLCAMDDLGPCMGEVTPVPESCGNAAVDDDCNGTTDDIIGLGATCTNTATAGICRDGIQSCQGDTLTCVTPTATHEVCNNLDDDCDGQADEDFPFLSDNNNCGGCNRPCGAGTQCCAGQCVDTHSDPGNCNTCGNACGQGRDCCNSQCTDLETDENNCNTCGNACPSGFQCCGATCFDTRTATSACGNCSTQCTGANQRCCNSVCAAADAPACSGCSQTCGANETCCAPISPVCANRMTDHNNCGTCGHVCGGNQICCGGQCVANDSNADCGTCGNMCGGSQRCCSGMCTDIDASNCSACMDVCMAGAACCVTGCESTNDDESNCSGCGITCAANRSCSHGSCCLSGWTGCGAASGMSGSNCQHLSDDHDNCGSCGRQCGGLESCRNGLCCTLALICH